MPYRRCPKENPAHSCKKPHDNNGTDRPSALHDPCPQMLCRRDDLLLHAFPSADALRIVLEAIAQLPPDSGSSCDERH